MRLLIGFSSARSGLPLIEVHNGLYWRAVSGLEVRAFCIGDRYQGDLSVGLVWNSQQFSYCFSCAKCRVVHAVPKPRARAASIKLQAAGMIDPIVPACALALAPSALSMRPSMQGIISTGALAMFSAK